MFINNELYCTVAENNIFKKIETLKDFDKCYIDVGISEYNPVTLYKINSKFYDYDTYLRKYIPYCVSWNINNDYYILNRDYEYIGLNTKSIIYENKGQSYLFNDGTTPWSEKQHFIKMCDKLKIIIKENCLKECLNPHNLNTILTLFDDDILENEQNYFKIILDNFEYIDNPKEIIRDCQFISFIKEHNITLSKNKFKEFIIKFIDGVNLYKNGHLSNDKGRGLKNIKLKIC